jgi:hypothetical protein
MGRAWPAAKRSAHNASLVNGHIARAAGSKKGLEVHLKQPPLPDEASMATLLAAKVLRG